MSDEGRAYVKAHSPYAGTTWWFHYVMGDIANAAHDYRIFISDKKLAEEWPITRSAASRSRAQLIADGYLIPLSETTAPGKPREYRFEFLGAEAMRRGNAPRGEARSDKDAPRGEARTRRATTRERASKAEPVLLPTEGEQKGTEIAAPPQARATDDPRKRHAREIAILAFEQPVKPALAHSNGNAFAAVMALIERVLESGQSRQAVERAIRDGVNVWTLAGLQTAIAQANPRTRRRTSDTDERDLEQILQDAAANERTK